jgi:hypothetical protein
VEFLVQLGEFVAVVVDEMADEFLPNQLLGRLDEPPLAQMTENLSGGGVALWGELAHGSVI